jgi:hypothetical protein
VITMEQALDGQEFHHNTETQANGKLCFRVRRNGKTQTWKTRPGEFRIPVKHGISARGQGQIHDYTAADWHVASECPRSDQL